MYSFTFLKKQQQNTKKRASVLWAFDLDRDEILFCSSGCE